METGSIRQINSMSSTQSPIIYLIAQCNTHASNKWSADFTVLHVHKETKNETQILGKHLFKCMPL